MQHRYANKCCDAISNKVGATFAITTKYEAAQSPRKIAHSTILKYFSNLLSNGAAILPNLKDCENMVWYLLKNFKCNLNKCRLIQ